MKRPVEFSRVMIILALLCGPISGCGDESAEPDQAAPETLFAVVSIVPQVEIVTRVAGDAVRVEALIKPGASPATFDLTPHEIADVVRADVLFTIGVPADRLIEPNLRGIAPELVVVDMAQGVEKRTLDQGSDHSQDSHHHGSLDPHVWLDLEHVITMAGKVRNELCALDSDRCSDFSANLTAYKTDLQAADARIAALLEPFAGRRVCVFHPAYGYFLERYGLHQIAVEVEGKEPTPRQLVDLVKEFRGSNIQAVFVQPQFSDRSAQAVAKALEVEVVPLDPLAADHLANLESMAETVARSLAE